MLLETAKDRVGLQCRLQQEDFHATATHCSGILAPAVGGDGKRAVGAHRQSLPANAAGRSTAIKNAPFSAVVITQYDRVLGNGNHIHRETRGKVYRDDQGRVRTETEFATRGNGGEQFLRVTILDTVQRLR